jgi:ABC-type dipeptide/oligopeptide/nickel transport system permease subunit
VEHWTPATAIVAPDSGPRPPSVVERLLRDPKVVCAGGFIVLLIILAVAAPLIAPYDPLAQNLLIATAPPVGFADSEPGYLLGTDGLGRDVLSRVIFGTPDRVAAGPFCRLSRTIY